MRGAVSGENDRGSQCHGVACGRSIRGARARRVNTRKVTSAHLYRVLYGNPKGGVSDNLNSHPVVRL